MLYIGLDQNVLSALLKLATMILVHAAECLLDLKISRLGPVLYESELVISEKKIGIAKLWIVYGRLIARAPAPSLEMKS
jgi:hypothetical protein